ncbi:MAG: hypothetical protein JST68_08145 [Bacteroidetes bacterium]|nr:hypothetical protein [Bacteroidota bacterium]
MDVDHLDLFYKVLQKLSYSCPLCGAPLYVTNYGNYEAILHCSSDEARFWNFERGTQEQIAAKQHWDQSRKELFLTKEDITEYLQGNEPV